MVNEVQVIHLIVWYEHAAGGKPHASGKVNYYPLLKNIYFLICVLEFIFCMFCRLGFNLNFV